MIAPVRMLIDGALHDLAARDAGMPLAAWIGGDAAERVISQTNQTLFWSSDESFLTQAEAYVDRGFRDLKVRVAVEEISEDMRRIAALRERFGATDKDRGRRKRAMDARKRRSTICVSSQCSISRMSSSLSRREIGS